MAVSLYELESQYRAFLDEDVDPTPDDIEAWNQLIAELRDDIQVKAVKIGYVVRSLDYEGGVLRDEEKRLAERRRARERKIERLKEYVFQGMKAADIRKAEAVDISVAIQKNPPSLRVLDESAVPPEYWKQPPPVMDRAGLKTWVKDHEECDFAYLEQTESLRIK